MKSLFHIGNSVSLFFAALLLLSIIIIFSFDKNAVSPYASSSSVPKIEVGDFVAYEIDEKSLLSKLVGGNAKQFDSYEEISNAEFYRKSSDSENSSGFDVLKAPTAIRKDNIIYFDNGVHSQKNGYDMYSKIAVYNVNSKLLDGKEDFSIVSKFDNIQGQNLYYDSINGIARANNIKAIFKPRGEAKK